MTAQTTSDKAGRTDRQIQRTTTGGTSLVSAAITRLAQVIVERSTPVVEGTDRDRDTLLFLRQRNLRPIRLLQCCA